MKEIIQNHFKGNYQTFYSRYLPGIKKAGGDEYKARCPFPNHEDVNASFNFSNQTGQYYCHGCGKKGDAIHFYAKIKSLDTKRDFGKILKGIAGDFGIPWEEQKHHIVKTYDYTDETGNLLYQVCRMEPKDFRQRRPDGKGWIWNLNGTRRALYRLPEIMAAQEVLIVEGEKDADNLMELGLTATTCPMGAKKWRPEYNEALKGKDIVLIPDNDLEGKGHMTQVAISLNGQPKSLKLIELPDLPSKGDVSDWIVTFDDKAEAAEKLSIMIEGAGPYEPPKKATIENVIHETDLGNALRLVNLHGKNIRYCHAWHKWLIWDGKRWKIDDQGQIRRKAKDTIFKIYRELDRCPDKDSRERLFKHAIKSEADQRIKAMLSMAESESGIPITPDELDKDPWVLNCENGTLDLRTGILGLHNKNSLITKICPVSYDKEAQCPKWKKFLISVLDKNEELIEYLKRVVGYSLTGSTREQCLFFLYGTGANGKSTFLEVILALLNDYARRADFSTFLVKYGESIRNDIARLKGARFVSAIETAEGKRLAEGIVKQLTGQDMVAARFLRQEFFEYLPEFKIWLAANHKPNIIGTDYAIWRRIKVIPFTITIPEKLQNPNLATELKDELPGILSWAIEGCLAWQNVKLREPKEVKLATAKYKDDMDIIGDFLKDFCTIGSNNRIQKGELYKQYAKWCDETGEKKMTKRKFGICILDRGFGEYSDGHTRFWLEIKLR